MELVLIPGFWLDGSSWDDVARPIREAGHTVHTPTLPGLESQDANREGIGLRDHVDAVVALIDSTTEPVVLVGHSGGGAIAHAAADARPDRVARVVYVDSGPLGDGGAITDEFPVVGNEIPLPDWSEFGEEDLVDLNDDLRARFLERAIPEPARVATDKQVLSDSRRYDVPVTVIACEFPTTMLREWMDQGSPYTAELAQIRSVELIDLPTGHWPQFTRPADLADAILSAVER
ncbi:MAG: alpha/beta fold hydrolase [Acidimicrobiia bacterium]